MECRLGCGACCTAPSIAGGIPGMSAGKPAGVPCIHLDEHFLCRLFDSPERPSFCGEFKPMLEVCGNHREEALQQILWLENATMPKRGNP